MFFLCPRCARRHEFPAARMNAAGRVPCKCEATLILVPTSQSRPLSSPDLENQDIIRLGYRIRVEDAPRAFEMLRRAIQEHMTPPTSGPVDDRPRPARQAGPFLLAAGVAWDPRLFVMPAVLSFLVISLRWPLTWLAGAAPSVGPLSIAIQAIAGGLVVLLAAPAAAVCVGASIGEERDRCSAWRALASLFQLRRGHLGASVVRSAMAPLLLMAAFLMASSTLDQVAAFAHLPWPLRVAAGPVGVLLVIGALLSGLAVLIAVLTHSALAHRAAEMLPVQFELGVRRIRGRDRLLPGRTLAIGTAASLFALLALAGADTLLLLARPTQAAAGYAEAALGMELGRDLLLALSAGVWISFVGVAGMLSDRPAAMVVARPPSRAPEIITGTQKAMQAVMESPLERSERDDGRAVGDEPPVEPSSGE